MARRSFVDLESTYMDRLPVFPSELSQRADISWSVMHSAGVYKRVMQA